MRKLLLIIPLLLAAPAPANASIYANLMTREVIGKKDGSPVVKVTDGITTRTTTNQKAKFPVGTSDLKKGQELKVPMNDAGYEYYLEIFEQLIKEIPRHDPTFADIGNSSECALRFSDQIREQCKEILATRTCKSLDKQDLSIKNYPIDEERRVTTWLNRLFDNQYCFPTKLLIGCRAGRCWGVSSSGEYGFYPGKINVISIDGRKWSFIDYLSRQQELEIWQSIKDGSRYAYQLVHWPYESQVTGSQILSVPKGLKDKVYRMSLVKP